MEVYQKQKNLLIKYVIKKQKKYVIKIKKFQISSIKTNYFHVTNFNKAKFQNNILNNKVNFHMIKSNIYSF